jgi:hypothetical protein
MTKSSFAHLSDEAVIHEVARLARDERRVTAHLIAALAELDARRLYLGEGCSSLFTYCTRVLHLSEHAAYGRIEAARAARKFPVVLEMLADGDLTLTAVGLLAPHLTPANHEDILERAKHRTKREVEEIVAALRPLPDLRSLVRKQPVNHAWNAAAHARAEDPPTTTAAAALASQPPIDTTGSTRVEQRPVVKPFAPERYRVQLTVGRDTIDKLRRAQDLMRHLVPNGDPAVILDRALTTLLEDLEKRRLAATARPRTTAGGETRSRHVPAAVRRAVWKRDEGRCAFTGARVRCTETGFLEFHHVRPFAAGGETSEANVELRCKSHNQYEADLFFGPLTAREARMDFDSVQTEHERKGSTIQRLWAYATPRTG